VELLETQDPERRRLMEEANRHKQNLEGELSLVSDRTQKIVTNALIIGGALALSYLLVNQLSKTKKKKRKARAMLTVASAPTPVAESQEEDEEPSVLAQIGDRVVSQATLVLLDIARSKLMEYLEARNNKKDEHS